MRGQGYEKNGNTLVCKDEEGYIYLPVTDEEINDVKIVFSKGYTKNCDIKLEYVCKNSAQSDDDFVISSVNKGDKEMYFALDNGVYTVLRCHIPGSFEIKEIVLSHITSQNVVTKDIYNRPLLFSGIPILVCAYAAFVFVYFVKKKNK